MSYTVIFNCADYISKMPKRRRSWEKQLLDDFIRAIHRKSFDCQDEAELRKRLDFIQGFSMLDKTTEKDVVRLSNKAYGERVMYVILPSLPLGYVSFERLMKRFHSGTACLTIPFKDFYDMRQKPNLSGCYIEILKVDDV